MDVGLFHGAVALEMGARRIDTITTNLANIATPGFKRFGTTQEAFESRLPGRSVPGLRSQQVIDFSQGPLERTANPTDLALMGEGFFAVESEAGEVYTRNGSFRLGEQGVLLTAEGRPVVWEGSRGTIDPVGEALVVDPRGEVRQGARVVGRLRLVAFDRPQALRVDGDGYYHAGPRLATQPAEAEVHQGALERSNVQAVEELVSMIGAQRRFEHATNILRSIDQTYRRLTSTARG
jgi:flagellar basal body rod protein FlgG